MDDVDYLARQIKMALNWNEEPYLNPLPKNIIEVPCKILPDPVWAPTKPSTEGPKPPNWIWDTEINSNSSAPQPQVAPHYIPTPFVAGYEEGRFPALTQEDAELLMSRGRCDKTTKKTSSPIGDSGKIKDMFSGNNIYQASPMAVSPFGSTNTTVTTPPGVTCNNPIPTTSTAQPFNCTVGGEVQSPVGEPWPYIKMLKEQVKREEKERKLQEETNANIAKNYRETQIKKQAAVEPEDEGWNPWKGPTFFDFSVKLD